MRQAYSEGVPDAILKIAPDSSLPIYRQLADQVRTHIESRVLSPGDALPPVRSLAAQLGIHFNTVAEAYRALAEEGSIELMQGKRAVVRPSGFIPAAPEAEAESLRRRLRHLLAEMRLKGIPTADIRNEVNAIIGS